MTDSSNQTRRRFLGLAGTVAAVAVAGCTGAPAADSGTSTETHHEEETHHDETTEAQGEADHEHHGDHHHESLPESPSASAEVRMLNSEDGGFHFSPHVVWVEEGATVTFHNESGTHSATAYTSANDRPRRIPEGAESFDSGLLSEEGATFEHTFETAGVYDYFCLPHESTGMLASIIVGEPDPHDQPGLAEPQSNLPETAQEKIHDLNERCNQVLGHTH